MKLPYPVFQSFAYLTSVIPVTLRMGHLYQSNIHLLEQARLWSAEIIRHWQLEQFKKIIRYSVEYVPWYHDTYSAAGIDWRDIRSRADIQKLPVVDKKIILQQIDRFISRVANIKHLHETVTSGSTGIPLKFYLPPNYTAREKAFLSPLLSRYGCSNNDRYVVLRTQRTSRNPHTPFWTCNPHRNQLVVSTYHLSNESISAIAKAIRRFKPKYVLAIPSIAALFSTLLLNKKESIGTPPKIIILGSENSYRSQREHISRAFQCPTIMHYGQTEGVATATEIRPFGPYHVNPLYGYTEILKERGTAVSNPGESGEIVGTSFFNYAMPLIRYRTSDIATISGEKSEWGLVNDVWERIDGRAVELIKTIDGRWIMAAALIFGTHDSTLSNVEQVQIEQHVKGQLIIRIIRGEKYSEMDEQAIRGMIDNFTKNGFNLIFEYVDSIHKSNSGKHPLLIQHLTLPGHITS